MAAPVGTVKALSRFPVKSMLGESPDTVEIVESGIVGDRAWGLIDTATGKVASAKHPGEWSALLWLRATYPDGAGRGHLVRIELPDGTTVTSNDADVDARLSAVVGHDVHLTAEVPGGASYDEEWPEVDGLAPAEFIAGTRSGRSVTGSDLSALPIGMLAPGTFQDVAPLTVMTTASLRMARSLHPDGDWDDRRFRSTLLIDCQGERFVEQDWVGKTLQIGEVELTVTAPTPRCVMVTLAQQGLPGDADALRTLAAHNRIDVMGMGLFACLGVYSSVVRSGRISTADPVCLR